MDTKSIFYLHTSRCKALKILGFLVLCSERINHVYLVFVYKGTFLEYVYLLRDPRTIYVTVILWIVCTIRVLVVCREYIKNRSLDATLFARYRSSTVVHTRIR